MDEFELKFAVPTARRSGVARILATPASRTTRVQAIYFDTEDERLAASRITLRLRKEGKVWMQTAKADTADPLRRLEHNVELTTHRGIQPPVLDIARHRGTSVGKALRAALRAGRNDLSATALVERFRTNVRRTTRTVRVETTEVELALDVGKITCGHRQAPVCEFELEVKSGPVVPLFRLAARWAEQHGLWLTVDSKAARGRRLARGEKLPTPAVAEPLDFDAARGSDAFVRAALQNSLVQILRNAGPVAAGEPEAEFVHQLRIGLRRLRTALREVGDRVGADPAWEKTLGETSRELGRQRDAAVVLPAILARLDAVGALAVEPLPPAPTQRPDSAVRASAFQSALIGILACCHAPSMASACTSDAPPVRALAARRLNALHRKLERDAARFDALDAPAQHRVRKRVKRLRYLSEFCVPLFGKGTVRRYLAAWHDAQAALGELNDQRMACSVFLSEAARDPRAWFAVGWLNARNAACVRDCRRALRRGAKQPPFWKK